MNSSDPPSAALQNNASLCFEELPCPDPLLEAVAAGIFGASLDGCHTPDKEEVRTLTEEHAREMACLLADQRHAQRCLEQGIDPNSLRRPRNVARQMQLQENLVKDIAQFAARYQACVHAYADAFGYTAADQLDAAVQKFVTANDRQTECTVQGKLF